MFCVANCKHNIVVSIHIAAAFQTYMITSTATRTKRYQKMTKEDNSGIVVASTGTSEETAKGPSKTNNDEIAASTADATEISTTDKPTSLGGNVEGDKDADKMNVSNEEVQAKADEASVVVDSTVVNGGEVILKTDASLAEATGNSAMTRSTGSTPGTAAAGDAELTANFPQKLMEILSNEEYIDIIHWLPHGKGFIIADKKLFADVVLPKYFKKAKFTSFTRKLNRWNFVRITRGPEVGSYYHPNFQKENLNLLSQMTCIGSKQPQAVKPLDPIALGVVPMGEPIDAATEALGGIHQWQRQDHERYRLFYQQNHWNYMMQMMQQASAAKSQQDPDAAAVTTGTSDTTEESTAPGKIEIEGSDSAKTEEKKVEADPASDEPSSMKAEL